MDDRLRATIRTQTQHRRETLTDEIIKQKSLQISQQVRQLDLYRYAKRIALYIAVRGEVTLNHIWHTAPFQGKYCYFPVLKDGKLIFLPATPKSPFKKNKYGILEPQVDELKAIPLTDLDLVLMPLVAFDEYGNRLGMGKGYYDKTFSDVERVRPGDVHLLGVAYEFQHYEVLPYQHWDVPLDGIVTEKKVYWSGRR